MLVLGLDPGTATTGYGLVKEHQAKKIHLEHGVIKTPAKQEMALRLKEINNSLNIIISKYQPDVVAVEQLFHFKNAKTVISVAQGRGVAIFTVAQADIEVAEYTPLQVKQAVTGYGHADKKQVQIMVQKILGLDTMPKPDDAADALAIAICHLHSYRILSLYKGG